MRSISLRVSSLCALCSFVAISQFQPIHESNLEALQQITRRSFLKSAGQFSLGAIALAKPVKSSGPGHSGPKPARSKKAPLSAQGQAGDLFAHVRRSSPFGPVRLQARARQME